MIWLGAEGNLGQIDAPRKAPSAWVPDRPAQPVGSGGKEEEVDVADDDADADDRETDMGGRGKWALAFRRALHI